MVQNNKGQRSFSKRKGHCEPYIQARWLQGEAGAQAGDSGETLGLLPKDLQGDPIGNM